jgi:hypothetical protein
MNYLSDIWIWLGIVACVLQSALFSGLTLAVFSLTQLRLKIDAESGNKAAAQVLQLRENSNQVLTTLIWGNVSTNVLMTLLSDSVLAGVAAFLFSAVAITLLGEILPQAYFSRNALAMTARFLPFLRFYQVLLWPLAKPTAMLLDWWLGREGISYMRERDIRTLISLSAMSGGDISCIEAAGARNFLDLEDIPVTQEGEPIHKLSIICLPVENRRCVLPPFKRSPDDPFLRQVEASGKKWVIVVDDDEQPEFVLDAHAFLRDALLDQVENTNVYWHRPIIIRDMKATLGEVIGLLKVAPKRPDDDVIRHDLILVWGEQRRIITGSDLLGRLLRGIATVVKPPATTPVAVPQKHPPKPAQSTPPQPAPMQSRSLQPKPLQPQPTMEKPRVEAVE